MGDALDCCRVFFSIMFPLIIIYPRFCVYPHYHYFNLFICSIKIFTLLYAITYLSFLAIDIPFLLTFNLVFLNRSCLVDNCFYKSACEYNTYIDLSQQYQVDKCNIIQQLRLIDYKSIT